MTLRPSLPFLRADDAPPAEYEARLAELPLTVLVGVTGVGKSTALAALTGERLRVLPDRRRVADAVMILPLAGAPVTDREERFRLTALYRQTHPGGMAQALAALVADTRHWGRRPVFDGLRGLDEVSHAARECPAWRFVALGAPDVVRVRRLLGRADAFDRVRAGPAAQDLRAALCDVAGIHEVFSEADLDALAALGAEGFSAADVLSRARIVVSERRQYDPAAAEAFLGTLGRGRALLLDTLALSPAQVAQALRDWV